MPIVTRSKQTEVENESTNFTAEMENPTVKSPLEIKETQLKNNLKMLNHLGQQTQEIIDSKNERKWQRHQINLETKLNDAHKLITNIVELKIAENIEEEEINEWSKRQETLLERFENELDKFNNILDVSEQEKAARKQLEIDEREEERRLRFMDEEDKRRAYQRKLDEELELKRLERFRVEQESAKLPKLTITPFKGTCLDWFRFWEQFEAEVDKTKMATISKFSYLRELLDDQPKKEIIGLPFSEEGYTQAKEILKKKYGNISEIIQAHGREILKLPTITTVNLKQIHEFYRSLNVSVNSLKTLNKLDTAEILVLETLGKLGPVKADLIRTDPNWQGWGFEKLLEVLRDYTLRNPEKEETPNRSPGGLKRNEQFPRKERHYKLTEKRATKCVYCEASEHRSSDCSKVKEVSERREFLRKNRLCYNCTGSGHGAATCRSKNCTKCGSRHHTSLCSKEQPNLPYMIGLAEETIHPTLVVVSNEQKFRAMLDTGAGSSFASATFIRHLGMKPSRWEWKSTETMTTTVRQKLPIYDVKLVSTDGKEELDVQLTMLDKPVITTLKNPEIGELKKKFPYLRGLCFDNEDNREQHPIHLILGVGDLSRIKTSTCRVGDVNQPVAEKTTFGWTVMGPGKNESQINYFAKTSQEDYQKLCSLDVLGLQEHGDENLNMVHEEFKESLQRKPDGSYITCLPWKPLHPPLKDNATIGRARLERLLKKMERDPVGLQQYHMIIQDQITQGIVEPAPETPTGDKIFYLPHRPVIKESAETTKIRIVYDASSSENTQSVSLNDCLETGPPLQPLLHDVIVRNRLCPIGLTADVKQAFHQIWIEPKDRDVFRFFWISDLEKKKVVTLRFTRVPFGCVSSPFLLGATLQEHLNTLEQQYPETVAELRKDLYVDDVISGGTCEKEVIKVKQEAKEIFSEGHFTLHKWHCSLPSIEEEESNDLEQTFAKESLGTKTGEAKILGLKWNKFEDSLAVDFRSCKSTEEYTKRGILSAMAKVYDPLGLASPIMLEAKHLYRIICEKHLPWDAHLEKELEFIWHQWLRKLPDEITFPRSITNLQLPLTEIKLHGFGDASKKGCSAAIYCVVRQGEHTSQGLLASKSRIAKKELTIPRLELVAAHMVTNLVENVRRALEGYNITDTFAWSDSTVVLCWIGSTNREWKQFVTNRVLKIRQAADLQWKYCPTGENPADIGSRGSNADNLGDLWRKGPGWLSKEDKWPEESYSKRSNDIKEEEKIVKQLNFVAIDGEANTVQDLLNKFRVWKVIRVVAWVRRFIHNCRSKSRKHNALTTREIQEARKCLVRMSQTVKMLENDYQEISQRLGLTLDEEGILRCRGRVTGEYPVYIPTNSMLARRIIEDAHERTLHGGVTLTMAKIRDRYWIERLRRSVKSMINKCYKCLRYRVKSFPSPTTAPLPEFRTQGERAFQTVGVDFAGPLEYKISKTKQGKAYIALYTCATSRAVHLHLLPDMTADEFKRSLGEFIARRGLPCRIVSDNGKTFVATAKWLNKLKRNHKVNDFLARRNILWLFNLARSPWWGGFFERMVGLMKTALR